MTLCFLPFNFVVLSFYLTAFALTGYAFLFSKNYENIFILEKLY